MGILFLLLFSTRTHSVSLSYIPLKSLNFKRLGTVIWKVLIPTITLFSIFFWLSDWYEDWYSCQIYLSNVHAILVGFQSKISLILSYSKRFRSEETFRNICNKLPNFINGKLQKLIKTMGIKEFLWKNNLSDWIIFDKFANSILNRP